MFASLLLLVALCAQSGTDQTLSHTTFTMERQGLHLDPLKQAITIDPEGVDLVFRLVTDAQLDASARVQASLVGPSLTTPLELDQSAADGRIVLNRSLFTEEGVYQLLNTRLTLNGQVLETAEPASADIQVAEKFVVTDIQVRELSQSELADLGYVFSEEDYYSVNFSLKFQVQSQTEVISVNVPAVFPRFENSLFSPRVLQDPFQTFVLAIPTFHSRSSGKGTGSLPGEQGGSPGTGEKRIPGLILIPGNFKYLKSHFNVTVVTLNAAPSGFDVRVHDLEARLVLPGPVPSGDLPITIQEPTRKLMVNLGEDGEAGTADDRAYILPEERASADYVVTGNLPGIHEIEILVSGEVDLPQGKEKVYSSAKSTIYVRSPEFAVTFEHPDVVVEDEPFDLVVRIQNKGEVDLEDFSMTLDPDRLVGVRLNGTHPVQSLSSIPQGGDGAIAYSLKSQVTGSVKAGFFKAANNAENAIQMSVGVGRIGERLSPYVLEFPEVFRTRFPAPLVTQLERYAKRALDVALSADHELPAGFRPMSPAVVREFNRTMALIAASDDYGNPLDQRLLELFSLWTRSLKDYFPLDIVRRISLEQQVSDLETAFGTALAQAFPATSPQSLLTQLAQANETTPNLFAYIIEADGALDMTVSDSKGRLCTTAGERAIPFSSMLPLGNNKHLIWLSAQETVPRLSLGNPNPGTPLQVTIHTLFPGSASPMLAKSDLLPLENSMLLELDPLSAQAIVHIGGQPRQVYSASAVAQRPLELLTIKQADPATFGSTADILGRSHILYFSKPIDLKSIVPLEDHIFIGGKPVVEGLLQKDGRTLIVSSRMPLGPYHPISYSISGLRSLDGQEMGDRSGTYEGSPFFIGVSVSGRIVDRNGRDLSKAQVFLWSVEKEENPETRRRAADGELVAEDPGLAWRIISKKQLDDQNRYLFEYAPFVPFRWDEELARRFHSFRVGILMADGLYEEREITPLGAGQEIVVDFSFLRQGSVQGHVRRLDGSPVPLAKVFVVSQHNPQSGGITQTDVDGFYRVDQVEVGQVLVKSIENNVIGLNSGYLTAAQNPVEVDLVIDRHSARLSGKVTTSTDGTTLPLAGAYVGFAVQGTQVNYLALNSGLNAPFNSLAVTDDHGNYTLADVPAGDGSFWVYHPYFDYSTRPLILNEGDNLTVDHEFTSRIEPIGVASGTVIDDQGHPVAGARMSLLGVVNWTDSQGRFSFHNLPLQRSIELRGEHPDLRATSLGIYLNEARLDNILFVMEGPISVTGDYLNANGDPIPYAQVYLAGGYNGGDFNDATVIAETHFDGSWSARLQRTGEQAFAGYRPPALASAGLIVQGGEHITLKERATRSLRVRLVDGADQPVVAKVYLKSTRPSTHPTTLGQPGLMDHSPMFTDEDGYALFTNLNVGEFEVYGGLNDLGDTPVFSSVLEEGAEPFEVVLRFPRAQEEANLFGTVFEADGSPAPEGTLVKVTVGSQNGFRVVDASGNFRFDELVTTSDPKRVSVLAYNPLTAHYESAFIDLHQDLNFRLDLTLRRKGTLRVSVVGGDGEPADFAAVQVTFADVSYVPPLEGNDGDSGDADLGTISKLDQLTPSHPVLVIEDVPVGPFIIKASSGNGFTGLRAYSMPLDGGVLDVVVRLEASSQISGVFLDHSEIPIGDAEIQLFGSEGLLSQRLSSSQPGEEGQFLFPDLPMRSYSLRGTDPDTNFKAHLEVITSPFIPAPSVTLRLDPIANLEGYVYNGDEIVPNALVTLISGGTKVLTGTDAMGRYRFWNLALKTYRVTATSPFIPGSVSATVQLNQAYTTQEQDLHYAETLELDMYVEASDGSAANHVLVSVYNESYAQNIGNSAYTDETGHALLANLLPGTYTLVADHPAELYDIRTTLNLSKSEVSPIQRQIRFPGWGSITGSVLDSVGQPLDQSITVHLNLASDNAAVSTDTSGTFRIGKIPLDRTITLTALNPVTREVATASTRLDHYGEEAEVQLMFHGSTTVSGSVHLADGQPAAFVSVSLNGTYTLKTQTNAYGEYSFEPVLEGTHSVVATDPLSPRKAVRDVVVSALPGQLPDPVSHHDLVLSGIGYVQGLATYSDGTIVPYGNATLYSSSLRTTVRAVLQGDGSFYFGQVPNGAWNLSVYDDIYAVTSPVTQVVLAEDNQVSQNTVIFPPSFTLSGTLIGPDRVSPIVGGRVKLWRPRSQSANTSYDLIYSGLTDAAGHYQIDHVYPGNYQIDGDDPDLLMNYKADFLMPNQDTSTDVYLENETWVQGTLSDAGGKLFHGGIVTLTQFGRTYTSNLKSDGSFIFRSLSAGPCTLAWRVSDGWTLGSRSEILGPGINRPAIVTGNTLTLSGRAILAKLPPSKPSAYLTVAGISKQLSLNASGDWIIDEVPAGVEARLTLRSGAAYRSFNLGSFSSSQDLGSFYLDAIGPAIGFADAASILTQTPYRMQFQLDEHDPDSLVSLDATRVWLNGHEISARFTTTQTDIYADFAYLTSEFILGANSVTVESANTSHVTTKKTFSFQVQLEGTTLILALRNNGVPVEGEVKLGDRDYVASDSGGQVVLVDVQPGNYALKARGATIGLRQQISVGSAVQQQLSLNLNFVGEYRGRVLGMDGNPLGGVVLSAGNVLETSDSEGNFSIDLLPLGKYVVEANHEESFAWRELPDLNLPGQIRLGNDVQLEGMGSITGHVFDDDGIQTIEAAKVDLEFTSLPDSFKRQVTADSNGEFRLDHVPLRAFDLSAFDNVSQRGGIAQGTISEPGATLIQDILLSPTGELRAQILDPQGDPVNGLTLVATGTGLRFETSTDADGRFVFAKLPYRAYTLTAERPSFFQYLKTSHTVDQSSEDIGALTLSIDQPPVVNSVSIPDPFDPVFNPTISMQFHDDRRLDHYVLTLSGAYNASVSENLSSTTYNRYLRLGIGANNPDGLVNYVLTVYDQQGHNSTKNGSFTISHDLIGPLLAFTAPASGASVNEGATFNFEASASDPASVTRVNFYMEGLSVGSKTVAPYKLSLRAPALSQDTHVVLRVEAFDAHGNTSSVERSLLVRAIPSSGAPNLSLISPVSGVHLPLDLEQGLALQVLASASDSDGLESVHVLVDGLEVYRSALSGTTLELNQSMVLPAELRNANTLELQVIVSDIGGNSKSANATLLALPGPYRTFAADQPLRLPAYDLSLEHQTLVLAGGSHIVDGAHEFSSLVLVNGALLSQTTTSSDQAYVAYTEINLDGELVVDLNSSINVDGKGYIGLPSGLGQGYGSNSHGGLGRDTSNLNHIYGSPFRPSLPGSHRGGGAIKVAANSIWIQGRIRANAGNDGSGGSIWLDATRFEGKGTVSANGYREAYESLTYGGGGGRVAIYGSFPGAVEAYGGRHAAPGTVYTRIPDPGQADGFFDRILVKAYPLAKPEDVNLTAIPVLPGQIVDTDVLFSTQYRSNQQHQVADFYQTLRLGSFVGMQVFKQGLPASSALVDLQENTRLWTAPDASFGTFSQGDLIDIDYQVDELAITDRARFTLMGNQPHSPLRVENAELLSGTGSVELLAANTALGAGATLIGNFRSDTLNLPSSGSLTLLGEFQLDHLSVAGHTLLISGYITATSQIDVAADAIVRVPDGLASAHIVLDAPVLNIDGLIEARNGGESRSSSYELAHGGLGGGSFSNRKTYDSFYQPKHGSSETEGPGRIELNFQECRLTGTLDTSAYHRGAGGTILLQGRSLTGNGRLLANGQAYSYYHGAGGRVGIIVDETTAFNGVAQTFGGRNNVADRSGAAGSVFWRTNQWPNGRLVLDNNGTITKAGSTLLPGLGVRTATNATGGTSISGTGFPDLDSLVGMYVAFSNGEQVRIASHTTSVLTGETPFPLLEEGATYRGLHRLDTLEIRGYANLKSIDPIEVLQNLVIEQGSLDIPDFVFPEGVVLSDGNLELFTDPGLTQLTLDHFELTVHFPLNLSQATLTHGSVLKYDKPIQVTGPINLDNSQLVAMVPGSSEGLLAQSLNLINGSTWTVGDRKSNGEAYHLRAALSGALTLDPSSLITTSGSTKVDTRPISWANGSFGDNSHGGYGSIGYDSVESPIMGSYADPKLYGGAHGGGLIRISAAEFTLDGRIAANGHLSGCGGSIRLDADNISGTGMIEAMPGNSGGGAGRVAIYYGQDRSFADTLQFRLSPSQSSSWYGIGGAGTLFLKGNAQAHGELIIDQGASSNSDSTRYLGRYRLTGATGPGTLAMSIDDIASAPEIISDPSWPLLPPGLAGLQVTFSIAGSEYEAMVLDNTYNAITLDRAVPHIPAGTLLNFVLALDRLILRDGAQFYFAGILNANEIIHEDPIFTSIWVKEIRNLPNPYVISNREMRLILDDNDLPDQDLEVHNGKLYLDKPLIIRDLTLDHSVVSSSLSIENTPRTLLQSQLTLTAHHIDVDAYSKFDVSNHHAKTGSMNHGGIGTTNDGTTHGNLFQPTSFGNGSSSGGRIHINAERISGGAYYADGKGGGAGSIWLEAQVLDGPIQITAYNRSGTAGGGRIAVYAEDMSTAQLSTRASGTVSAGTVFIGTRRGEPGRLIIDNYGGSSSSSWSNITPIPTFTTTQLTASATAVFDANTQVTTLTVPGLTLSMNFVGYHLVANGDLALAWPILDSANTSGNGVFRLAGDASALHSGDMIQSALKLTDMDLCSNCSYQPASLLILEEIPPVIDDLQVFGLFNGYLQPESAFQVQFSAHDNFAVTSGTLIFNGQSSQLAGAGPFVFDLQAPTIPGEYTLVVEARDANGNLATLEQQLTVADPDTTPPVITLLSPQEPLSFGEGHSFTASFQASDDRMVTAMTLTFGDQTWSTQLDVNQQQEIFEVPLQLGFVDGDQLIDLVLTATDLAGNIAERVIPVTLLDDLAPPVLTVVTPIDGTQLSQLSTFPLILDASDNNGLVQLSASFNGETQIFDFQGSTAARATLDWATPAVSQLTPMVLSYAVTDLSGNRSEASLHFEVSPYDHNLPKPVAYWSFDDRDRQDTRLLEQVHNLHGTALNGVALGQPGQTGQAIGLDGSNDRVSMVPAPQLALDRSLTLTAWVKSNGPWNDGSAVLCYGSEAREGFALIVRDGRAQFTSVDSSNTLALLQSEVLPSDSWIHLAATFDEGSAALYIDGQLVEQGIWPLAQLELPADATLALGVHHPGSDEFFRGFLDEVVLFPVALTATEVATLRDAFYLGAPIDLRPPAEVSELSFTQSGDTFSFQWTPATDLDQDLAGYRIILDGQLAASLEPNASTWTTPSLSPSVLHHVEIHSIDQSANLSPGVAVTVKHRFQQEVFPQPVSYWSFDSADRSGSLFYDLMGQNPMTLNGSLASSSVAFLGQSVRMVNSSANHFNLGNSASLNLRRNLTLSTWYYQNTARNSALFFLGDASTTSFALTVSSANQISFSTQDSAANPPLVASVSNSTWVHITATFDAGLAILYLNGTEVARQTWSVSELPQAASPSFYIGRKGPSDTTYLSCYLDEAAIWDQALSPTMVQRVRDTNAQGENLVGPSFNLKPTADVSDLTVVPIEGALRYTWTPPADADLMYLALYFDQASEPLLLPKFATSWTSPVLLPLSQHSLTLRTLDQDLNQSGGATVLAVTPGLPGQFPQPVAYWSMDDATRSGNLYGDLIGDQPITLSGTRSTPSYSLLGNAVLLFYSNANHFNLGDPPTLNRRSFTLSTWYRQTSARNSAIFHLGDGQTTTYSLTTTSTNQISFSTQSSVGNPPLVATLANSTWVHITLTFDQGLAILYLNGVEAARQNWSLTELPQAANPIFYMGRKGPSDTTYLNSYLDETAFWNQAINAPMVQYLYLTNLKGENLFGPTLHFAPPAKVTGLQAQSAIDSINFTWIPSSTPQIQDQLLYVDDSSEPLVLEASATSYLLEDLTPLSLHTLRIVSRDTHLNVNTGTRITTATLPDSASALPLPVSYWSYDDNTRTGNTHADLMLRNPAVLGGTRQNPSVNLLGKAVALISDSNYFNFPNPTSLLLRRNFTLATWFHLASARNATLFYLGDSSTRSYSLDLTSGGQLSFSTQDSQQLPLTAAYTVNSWNHVAVSFNNGQVALYLNGALVASRTWALSELPSPASPVFQLGRRGPSNSSNLGHLDETAIWDQALTPEMVAVIQTLNRQGEAISGPSLGLRPNVTDLSAVPSQDALLYSWTAPANPFGDLQGFQLVFDQSTLVEVPATTTTWTAENLLPLTSHSLALRTRYSNNVLTPAVSLDANTLPDLSQVPQPIVYWSFDQIEDQRVPDQMGRHDLELSGGPILVPGLVGQALEFDPNQSQEVGIADDQALQIRHKLTLSTWVKPTEVEANGTLLALVDSWGRKCYELAIGWDGFLHFATSANNQYHDLAATTALDQNWHHLAVTFDLGEVILFIDGVESARATWPLSELPMVNANPQFRLAAGEFNNKPFNFDETAIWNLALAPAFVQVLFDQGHSGHSLAEAPLAVRGSVDPTQFFVRTLAQDVLVSWTPAPNQPTLDYYNLILDDQPFATVPASADQFRLTGLLRGTRYRVRLQSAFSDGLVSASQELCFTTPPEAVPPVPDPVAWWRMDAGEVTTELVQEAIGGLDASNGGTLSTSSAALGEALVFDGIDNAVILPEEELFSALNRGDYSVSLWFKPDDLPANTNDNDQAYGLFMRTDHEGLSYRANGQFSFVHEQYGNITETRTEPMRPGVFHHLVAVQHERTSLSLYVDGHLVQTTFVTDPGGAYDFYTPWTLGSANPSAELNRWAAKGTLDQVRIFDHGLDQDEVWALYLEADVAGLPGDPGALAKSSRPRPSQPASEGLKEIHREPKLRLNSYSSDKILVFRGTKVTLDGTLHAKGLILEQGAELTLPATALPDRAHLNLIIDGPIFVDASSQIHADGRFLAPLREDMSPSHGGLAGTAPQQHLYGSAVWPMRPGIGPQAGAAIFIQAQSLQLDGRISATGFGFSSGGSMLIQAPQIRGRGTLDVSGGTADRIAAGGGRMALHGSDLTRFIGTVLTGTGNERGTLVLADARETGIYLGNAWPSSRPDEAAADLYLPVLPALEETTIHSRLTNAQGTMLEIVGLTSLDAAAGLWLSDETGQSWRILAWLPVGETRGFLQLQGELPRQSTSLFWTIHHSNQPHVQVLPPIYKAESP